MSYVLITPARNEELNIERTIKSVVSQTVLPVRWIIVNDGSIDKTEEIVSKYVAEYKWIKLIGMPGNRDRSFAAKAHSFNAGYELVKEVDYQIIGCLDADISFDNTYFEFLLAKLSMDSELGVAGTPFIEGEYTSADDSFEGEKHVAGGCQLFRRQCFEDIGGYLPIKDGIDWVAVTTARMKGWRTRSFREKYFHHHRKIGTGESNSAMAIFKYGTKDFTLGAHPLWVLIKIIYRVKSKPYFVGSLILFCGYLWAIVMIDRPISDELVKFNQREQMHKLKSILKSIIKYGKIDKFTLGK